MLAKSNYKSNIIYASWMSLYCILEHVQIHFCESQMIKCRLRKSSKFATLILIAIKTILQYVVVIRSSSYRYT